jgi:gamma-glutamyl-gamma-aminobutyrate hydrolase PuuD
MKAVYLTRDGVEDPFIPDILDGSISYREVEGGLDPKEHILFFGSGVDIHPRIYNQPIGRWTQRPHDERDNREIECWKEVVSKGIGNVGICRGAQLITALNGGKLYQHVDNHAGMNHAVSFWDGRTQQSTTSAHHQMMDLSGFNEGKDYLLLAWASVRRSPEYLNGWNEKESAPPVEPEVVYYPKTNSLCVQGHPEWMKLDSPFVQSCREFFKSFVLSKVA